MAEIDASVPHPARRYNYWLGGKDNFAVDRASADEIERAFPGMRAGVRANRALLGRAVNHLASEAGIRQFLDIGTGLPTAGNTHEVAQRVAPESRIVYVDNDPMVMAHAAALLTSSAAGRTAYIEADLRDPGKILGDPQLRELLDLRRPVALMLVAILHFLPEQQQEYDVVRELLSALPKGSFLAATHATVDFMPEAEQRAVHDMLAAGRVDVRPSSREQFAKLFAGLEMVEPGIELATRWRPDAVDDGDPSRINMYAGVGFKP